MKGASARIWYCCSEIEELFFSGIFPDMFLFKYFFKTKRFRR